MNPYFSMNFCSVSCHAVRVVTCCEVWTLGVWGELACHKRLFNLAKYLSVAEFGIVEPAVKHIEKLESVGMIMYKCFCSYN